MQIWLWIYQIWPILAQTRKFSRKTPFSCRKFPGTWFAVSRFLAGKCASLIHLFTWSKPPLSGAKIFACQWSIFSKALSQIKKGYLFQNQGYTHASFGLFQLSRDLKCKKKSKLFFKGPNTKKKRSEKEIKLGFSEDKDKKSNFWILKVESHK